MEETPVACLAEAKNKTLTFSLSPSSTAAVDDISRFCVTIQFRCDRMLRTSTLSLSKQRCCRATWENHVYDSMTQDVMHVDTIYEVFLDRRHCYLIWFFRLQTNSTLNNT